MSLQLLFNRILSKYVITFLNFENGSYLMALMLKTDFKKGDVEAKQIHLTGESLEKLLQDVIAEMDTNS